MKRWSQVVILALLMTHLCADDKKEDQVSSSYFYFKPEMIKTYLQAYSEAEQELIEKDLSLVRSIAFQGIKPTEKRPFYLATAGGPGARKSTILERFLANHPEYQSGAYLDPSQRGLKLMAHTYYAQSLNAKAVAENIQYLPIVEAAYNKWQQASIYITFKLIEEAFEKRLSVVHGTSSTADYISDFFTELQRRGYEIKMLLCSSKDQFRYDAVKYRNTEQKFYQSTPKEAFSKGKLFTERMTIYFAKADELYLYWSQSLMEPEQLVMILSKGQVQTLHPPAASEFIAKYEADRAALLSEGKDLPAWRDLIEQYQSRFKRVFQD